jgi:hypothetical protein
MITTTVIIILNIIIMLSARRCQEGDAVKRRRRIGGTDSQKSSIQSISIGNCNRALTFSEFLAGHGAAA